LCQRTARLKPCTSFRIATGELRAAKGCFKMAIFWTGVGLEYLK
jgi:hypothetical protein